jgi:predicted nucleic acid-binding protein
VFDLAASLRALKPQKRTARLERRRDAELRWADDEPRIGGALLLDTCVYLDVLQGRTPQSVDDLIASRICRHSAVCLAELTHLFGRLDPSHPSTKSVLRPLRETIEDIPAHRLHAPIDATWVEAGMLAGELARLSDQPKGVGAARKFLNDALIFMQARRIGAEVLTANVRDFDFLDQLAPSGRVVYYRRQATA